MHRTIRMLQTYWEDIITHLPRIHPPFATPDTPFSVVGIRLGYRQTGLLATYSLAPNTHHPSGGVHIPQDITDVSVPFSVGTDDILAWEMPIERVFYTPHGKVTIEGEAGPLHRHPPQICVHPL